MSDKKRNSVRIESPAETVERLQAAADAISSRHRMLREASGGLGIRCLDIREVVTITEDQDKC